MKHLRCIDPTPTLKKGEIYLCSLYKTSGKHFIEVQDLKAADYVKGYRNNGVGVFRCTADKFEEITVPNKPLFQQPNHQFMDNNTNSVTVKTEHPPYYTFIDIEDGDIKTNLSKRELQESLDTYDSDLLIGGIEDTTILILKHTVGKGENISQSIKFKPQIP